MTRFGYSRPMNLAIEFDREDDGRWIAEIPALPGVMAYGLTKADAESKVEALGCACSRTGWNAKTPP